jgi:hypothetical protein
MAIPNVTPAPRLVGAVVVGNGTYPTRFVRDVSTANWIKNLYFRRSAGAFTATVVPAYGDGTVAGANGPAKTYLQSLTLDQLVGPNVDIKRAQRLKA